MRPVLMLTCAALLAICSPLQCQEGESRPERRPRFGITKEALAKLVAKYDKDKDSKVSRDEYPRGDAGFTNLDRDGNGFIEEEDLKARRGRRPRGDRNRRRPQRAKLPQPGDVAPDFELSQLDKKTKKPAKKKVKLSSFIGDRPVALIFGSYT